MTTFKIDDSPSLGMGASKNTCEPLRQIVTKSALQQTDRFFLDSEGILLEEKASVGTSAFDNVDSLKTVSLGMDFNVSLPLHT